MRRKAVTIVIPAKDRVAPLRETLLCAAAALKRWEAGGEILVVDDASSPPLQIQLGAGEVPYLRLIRNDINLGAVASRQIGLDAAEGEFVCFLDSDDLIAPDKMVGHLPVMLDEELDVTYSDQADVSVNVANSFRFHPHAELADTQNPIDLYLRIQPAPQSPVYRREYLLRYLKKPLLAEKQEYSPVGDIWIYYNLAPYPAKVKKVPGYFNAAGPHAEDRFSRHWERLGAASLLLMEDFEKAVSELPEAADSLRNVLGELSFHAWRALPRDYAPDIADRLLGLYRRNRPVQGTRLGGAVFNRLAVLLGPIQAARMLKWLRGHSYNSCRTMNDHDLAAMLAIYRK